jgi:hypothetical protein
MHPYVEAIVRVPIDTGTWNGREGLCRPNLWG